MEVAGRPEQRARRAASFDEFLSDLRARCTEFVAQCQVGLIEARQPTLNRVGDPEKGVLIQD
jgi:hypothetical protein